MTINMELLVNRISSASESTLGNLFILDDTPRFECYTLEDQYNEPKIPGETRIPPGIYQITLRTEGAMHQRYGLRFPWHRGMLWLRDVPDFEWIYIHVGNKDDDTEGCILVGNGQLSNKDERGQVTGSVAAYKELYSRILDALSGGQEVWITIEDYA